MWRFMCGAALVIGIASCGGGGGEPGTGTTPLSNADPVADDTSRPIEVAYEGTTLVVDNVRYERPAGIELCSPIAVCENGAIAYAPGQIIVSFTSANALGANALISRLGLSVNSVRSNSLVVNVPVLYERQWVRALQQESVLSSADVNAIVQIG